MSDNDDNTDNDKKRRTRHVLKFRDFEIDEDDYHVLDDLLHVQPPPAPPVDGACRWTPKMLVDQEYVTVAEDDESRVVEFDSKKRLPFFCIFDSPRQARWARTAVVDESDSNGSSTGT